MLKSIGMAGLLLWGGLACAQGSVAAAEKPVTETSAVPEWLSAFTRCDGEFFRALKRDAGELRRVTPMGEQGEYAWIRVPDRMKKETSYTVFDAPVWVGELELVGYHDRMRDEAHGGRTHIWGFLVQGNLDEAVVRAVRPFTFEAERLQQDGEEYARFEAKSKTGDAWVSVDTLPDGEWGLIKGFGLIPGGGAESGLFTIMCMANVDEGGQGIEEIRPDLAFVAAAEHARSSTPEQVVIPARVLNAVAAATEALGPEAGWWKPKFQEVHYAQEINLPDRAARQETHIRQSVKEVLLSYIISQSIAEGDEEVTEEHAEGIHILGGLMPLQQPLPPEVWVTDQVLSLALPEKLVPGEHLAVEIEQVGHNSGQARKAGYACTFGDAVPASEIFESIPGRAIPVLCEGARGYFFLEDLGLMIVQLEGYQMVEFEVRR